MATRLQDQDWDQLHALADSTDKATARRAGIVLLAADGCDVAGISKTLRASERAVRYVMQKFRSSGAASVERQSPPGRHRMMSAPQKAALRELINQPPQDFGIPKEKWTLPALVDVIARNSMIEGVSRYTVRREILRSLEEHPGLRERVQHHPQDRPGAPVGNQNSVRHGAYSNRKWSADEESQAVELYHRFND